MVIELDYNPSPKNSFFITAHTSEKEDIAFDFTSKRTGIIKQRIIEKKNIPFDKEVSETWETIVIENGKFVKKYPVKWIDLGDKDWCNDLVFQLVWEKPLDDELKKKLLFYSHLICDNYQNLDEYSKEIADFERLITSEIEEYK